MDTAAGPGGCLPKVAVVPEGAPRRVRRGRPPPGDTTGCCVGCRIRLHRGISAATTAPTGSPCGPRPHVGCARHRPWVTRRLRLPPLPTLPSATLAPQVGATEFSSHLFGLEGPKKPPSPFSVRWLSGCSC